MLDDGSVQGYLGLGKQCVNSAAVKTDDHLSADDDRRGGAALIGLYQLLQRRGVLGDITFDKGDTLLRKILFRGMTGASTVGGI